MKEVLDKLTSYNLFNYLLPGVIFAVLSTKTTRFSLVQQDLVMGGFLYYFFGLVISRVGSLVLEPLLKRLSFVKYADYKDFVTASKADPKIDVLSEANNSYRTLCATFLLLLLVKLYDEVSSIYPFVTRHQATVLFVALMTMFLFAYRKQTSYISARIAKAGSKDSEDTKAKAATA